jgi:hypothetical protein
MGGGRTGRERSGGRRGCGRGEIGRKRGCVAGEGWDATQEEDGDAGQDRRNREEGGERVGCGAGGGMRGRRRDAEQEGGMRGRKEGSGEETGVDGIVGKEEKKETGWESDGKRNNNQQESWQAVLTLSIAWGRRHWEEEEGTRRREKVVEATERRSRKMEPTMRKKGKKKRLERDRQQSNVLEGSRWYLHWSERIWKASEGKRKRTKSVRTIVIVATRFQEIPQWDK